MAAGMLAFVLNDGLMKALFADMSLYQAIFLRGIITVPLIAMMMWHQGLIWFRGLTWDRDFSLPELARRDIILVLIRAFSELLATILFLTALSQMPLANVTAILQVLPLTVTMAAALFLNEKVGWRRWLAISIGFAGVLVIIRPGMDGFSIYSIWVLAAVACITVREITTRQLSADIPSLPVAMVTAIAICGLGAGMLPVVEWTPLTGMMWLYLGGAALAIVFGYLFSVMTMRTGDIGFVAPFRYTAMIWAILLGLLMFGDLPDMPTVVGTLIIVATGLYSLHREHLNRRQLQAVH
ncbi:MAG: EamA family transporter [Bacteroidetes bacterium]|nr:EamA family transporter [Bacteroidota bacterium]